MFQKHSWRAVCACFQIRNWLIISKIGGGGCGIIYKAKNVNSEEEVQHCGILPVSSFHLLGAGTVHERSKQHTGENTDSSFEGCDGGTHGRRMRAKEWEDSPPSEFVSLISVSMKDAFS